MQKRDALPPSVARLVEILAARADTSEIDSLVLPEHELIQNLADLVPLVGPRRFRKIVDFYQRSFSDWVVDVLDAFGDDRATSVRLGVAATQTRPIGRIAATNRRVTFGALVHFELIEGKPWRTWMFVDGLTILGAIGAIELVNPLPA